MIEKIDVAIEQLEGAIDLYMADEPKYVASLTLAGAAEEILGQIIRLAALKVAYTRHGVEVTYNLRPALDELADGAVEISRIHDPASTATVKQMRDCANAPRNKAKHHDKDDPTIWPWDARREAASVIDRAIDNYWKLMNVGLVPIEPTWMEAY